MRRCDRKEGATLADAPQWFAVLQAHVTAVQSNDTAVHLFREGRLDDAIAVLRRGLGGNPQYPTGHSNLGFLCLQKGQPDEASACLLRALALDPSYQDARDHLVDVLRALIDELVRIGWSEGFLSTQPGGIFDSCNRHIRTRAIGALIAGIGRKGIFEVDGTVIKGDLLLRIVINKVQQQMGYHPTSTGLASAWDGLAGRSP